MQQVAQNTNVLNVLTEQVNDALSGDNTVIAAPGAGLRLLLWHLDFVVAAAVNVTLKSGAGTSLSGAYPFQAAGGSFSQDYPAHAPLAMGTNLAFIINLSGAVSLQGLMIYTIERV